MIRNFKDWKETTERMVEFTENAPKHLIGKHIPISNLPGVSDWPNLINRFNDKIDINTLDVISSDDPTYESSTLPTFNELIKQGVMREWFPYKQYDIWDAHTYRKNGRLDVSGIVAEIKENGLAVTSKTVRELYKVWRNGSKGGIRDEINKTHVFVPRGGINGFNVHVTELHPLCEEWQNTWVD